jgi:nitroimidazol reductase NimA-like FMN-containing flavoprotein (pyridoxamine 5'-phosphate oxidase superfamily)
MPSRRKLIAMTLEEIRVYLASQPRLIVVSNGPNGLPHPVPMNFITDEKDRFIVTSFRDSQKVRNLERDPRAALLVESGFAYEELKSVIAYANAEIITDPELMHQNMRRMGGKEQPRIIPGSPMAAQIRASLAKRVVIRFTPFKYVSWDHSKLGGLY